MNNQPACYNPAQPRPMKPKDDVVIATLEYLAENMGERKKMGEALKCLSQKGYDVERPGSPDQSVFVEVFLQHADHAGLRDKGTHEEYFRIKHSAKTKLLEHRDVVHARQTRYITIVAGVIKIVLGVGTAVSVLLGGVFWLMGK